MEISGVQKYTGALENESIVFFFRKHWVRFFRIVVFNLVVGFLVFLGLLGLGGFFYRIDIVFLRAFYVFFAMAVSAVYLNIFFLAVVNYYFDLVVITENRIIIFKKTTFLRNDSEGIDLTKIQDFGVEAHGVFCNYLGYGQLVIILSTSSPPVRISYSPMPHQKLEYCNKVKRDYIWSRRKSRGDSNDSYLQDIDTL